jgi:hypothetical protein
MAWPFAVYFCACGGTGLADRFVCLCGCADVEVLVFFACRFQCDLGNVEFESDLVTLAMPNSSLISSAQLTGKGFSTRPFHWVGWFSMKLIIQISLCVSEGGDKAERDVDE